MSVLKCTDGGFLSFLEGCLQWDASERFKPEDALKHEWVLEVSAPTPPPQLLFRDSSQSNAIADLPRYQT